MLDVCVVLLGIVNGAVVEREIELLLGIVDGIVDIGRKCGGSGGGDKGDTKLDCCCSSNSNIGKEGIVGMEEKVGKGDIGDDKGVNGCWDRIVCGTSVVAFWSRRSGFVHIFLISRFSKW